MIQRIQSIYLLMLIIGNSIFLYKFSIIKKFYTTGLYLFNIWEFIFVIILGMAALFMYKNRKKQLLINILNIILNLTLLVFGIYTNSKIPFQEITRIFVIMFPALSIILLLKANRAIKKDEKLVRSVDRIR